MIETFRTLGLLLIAQLVLSPIWAEPIRITVPRVSEAPQSADFYIELLERSFIAIEVPLEIEVVETSHLRSRQNLRTGSIDLAWVLESERRDQLYIPIPVGLTNGLIGKRLLLIRPQDQPVFDQIEQLSDFARLGLVAGFGEGWYDAAVWETNDLPYIEHTGQWRYIYPMLVRGREYDYFPRGMNEILTDAGNHPGLAIEENLILEYERDFIFYLSPHAAHLEDILTRAVVRARDTGLIDTLVQKYWGDDLESVHSSDRRTLPMMTPDH